MPSKTIIIFLLFSSLSQILGQQCINPDKCRISGCCEQINEGDAEPDWRDGTNCTTQIPSKEYEVLFINTQCLFVW